MLTQIKMGWKFPLQYLSVALLEKNKNKSKWWSKIEVKNG